MIVVRRSLFFLLKLFFLWILLFDAQRLIFSLHNWGKLSESSFSEWLMIFVHSFRLDLATAAFLIPLPFLFFIAWLLSGKEWLKKTFIGFLFLEILICAAIHAGEVNAYTEWNHKLTTRVFMHLLNPDEVFRTADGSMTGWFIFYFLLEIGLGILLLRWLMFPKENWVIQNKWFIQWPSGIFMGAITSAGCLLLGRGGTQPIPINIDAAYFSKNYVVNDAAVNSAYFFMKSFLLFNRSQAGAMFPEVETKQAKIEVQKLFNYPEQHNNYLFQSNRPNIVVLVLESWTANGIGSITGVKSATPYFDKLTKEGVLFTRFYATGGTSEIGNSSLFSGYPALPEISVSMQPDKHRKLPSLNQDLKKWGYTSHYLFSGDLKYGNIGGYFMDHGFDEVKDENNFPKGLQRGKLNYYDQDLYRYLMQKIDKTTPPFMHCAFTGSTHSPYDFPDKGIPNWNGTEQQFMRSMLYADKCLHRFLQACKKKKWYKNTVFVLVADHGHASSSLQNPNLGGYFHIPLLIFGEPLKKEWRGKKIDKVGSQADLARTLLYQLKGDYRKYHWSKDLLNPEAPGFALHTINRGYGWITDKGNFSYNMDMKQYLDKTYSSHMLSQAKKTCHSLMSLIYNEYKEL
jgi:phosphoglycerol transferase MdoB-like AlkP superfamily enzyme